MIAIRIGAPCPWQFIASPQVSVPERLRVIGYLSCIDIKSGLSNYLPRQRAVRLVFVFRLAYLTPSVSYTTLTRAYCCAVCIAAVVVVTNSIISSAAQSAQMTS